MRRARAAIADGAVKGGVVPEPDAPVARDPSTSTGTGEHPEAPDWLSAAGRPAFEELRNVMLLLGLRVSGVRRALVEMGPPLGEYLRPEIARDLSDVSGVMDDLTGAMGEIETDLETLRATLSCLEELVVAPRRSSKLSELVRLADSLAQHHTRPTGGVRWRLPVPDPTIALPRTVAIAALGNALSLLGLRVAATAGGRPIEVDGVVLSGVCALSFESALSVADLEDCARSLAQMFGDDPSLPISVRDSVLVLELPVR